MGPSELLIGACEVLGLAVRRESSQSAVIYKDRLVAKIVGDKLIPDYVVMDQLMTDMPAVSESQGNAFDRILEKLERDQIAVHEAGHTIVGVCFGFCLLHVKLDRDGCSEVEFSLNPIDDDGCSWTDTQLRQYQQCYAAGAAAERVLFQKEREHGKKRDMWCHAKLEKRLNQSRQSGFEEDIRSAMELLDKSLVEMVATALKQHGSLDQDEVAKLMDL